MSGDYASLFTTMASAAWFATSLRPRGIFPLSSSNEMTKGNFRKAPFSAGLPATTGFVL